MSIKEITCNLLKIVKTGKYCLYCNDDQEWIIVDHFVRNLSYYTFTVSELWNVSFPLVYISHFLWCTCFDCYQLECMSEVIIHFNPTYCTDCSMHFNEIPWFYISLSVVGMTILDIWSVKTIVNPFDGEKIGRGLSY